MLFVHLQAPDIRAYAHAHALPLVFGAGVLARPGSHSQLVSVSSSLVTASQGSYMEGYADWHYEVH